MPIDARFDLPAKKAIAFFRSKGYATSFAWQDLWKAQHDEAFTIAKMLNVDLLRDVRLAVDKALADGQTLDQFRDLIKPRLLEAGWWGKADMQDPATGEVREVQLGSPRRLQVIFETNMEVSYAAGHWAQIQETKADAPYLMYDAVGDSETRPEHAAWDGTVLAADDPWWQTHFPPNDWGCRCSVIQLSGDQVAGMGKDGPDQAPAQQLRDVVNPRTGEVERLDKGVGAGWNYTPGATRADLLDEQLAGKQREFRNGQ